MSFSNEQKEILMKDIQELGHIIAETRKTKNYRSYKKLFDSLFTLFNSYKKLGYGDFYTGETSKDDAFILRFYTSLKNEINTIHSLMQEYLEEHDIYRTLIYIYNQLISEVRDIEKTYYINETVKLNNEDLFFQNDIKISHNVIFEDNLDENNPFKTKYYLSKNDNYKKIHLKIHLEENKKYEGFIDAGVVIYINNRFVGNIIKDGTIDIREYILPEWNEIKILSSLPYRVYLDVKIEK